MEEMSTATGGLTKRTKIILIVIVAMLIIAAVVVIYMRRKKQRNAQKSQSSSNNVKGKLPAAPKISVTQKSPVSKPTVLLKK